MSTVRKRGNFFLNNILLMQVHGTKNVITTQCRTILLIKKPSFSHDFGGLDRQMWVGPLKVSVCLCECMCVCGERKQDVILFNIKPN